MPDTRAPSAPSNAAPIAVLRREVPAGPGDLDRLIARLEREPGLFHGCDVALDPLYRRRAIALAGPAVRIEASGDSLDIRGLDGTGRALVDAWRQRGLVPDAARYAQSCTRWHEGAHPLVAVLRGLLGSFAARWPELGLHGAWSFEHWRLAEPSAPVIDGAGAPRCVLFLASRVLVCEAQRMRWVTFEFPGLEVPAPTDCPGDPPAGGAVDDPAPDVGARSAHALQTPADDFPAGAYAPAIARAIARIRNGELWSLTMSQAFRRHWVGDAAVAFSALRRRVPMPEMFFANFGRGERLFGASPDLQARVESGRLECAPACGTLPRGRDASEDLVRGAELLASDKEAASLALCSDAFAAAMRTVCEPGSVRVDLRRRIVHFATVVHGIDRLVGRLRADADGFDVLLATAAPPTLAGVPRVAAASAIAQLEASPRGWYGGAIGSLGSDGSAWLGTVLRAAWLRGDRVELRSGGSIVGASVPDKEDEETRVKAQALFRLLGLADERAQRSPRDAAGGANAEPDTMSSGPSTASSIARPVAAPTCMLLSQHDPLAGSLADALARVGFTVARQDASLPAGDLQLVVCSSPGAAHAAARPAGATLPPLLLVGEAAAHALRGDASTRRAIAEQVTIERCDASLATFRGARFGMYLAGGAPATPGSGDWQAMAWDADARVLVAIDRAGRRAALLVRPDSVLSEGDEAGVRLLRFVVSQLLAH